MRGLSSAIQPRRRESELTPALGRACGDRAYGVFDDVDWQALAGEALSCRNRQGDVEEHLQQAGRAPILDVRVGND